MLNRRLFLSAIVGTHSAAFGIDESQKANRVKKRIAIAYALGGKGDQSYNDAVARALAPLRQIYDVSEFSPLTLDDYTKALPALASRNPSLVFCVGYVYDTFVAKFAPAHPASHFCVLDGLPDKRLNTLGIQFKVREASALAGVVAADNSKAGRLAFVGGSDIAPIRAFLDGFSFGAQRRNPNVKIDSSFIGAGAEAFRNAARGKDIALQLLGAGADVIFHAAGPSGNGVIAAAKERRRYAIGVDVDQTHLAPGLVLTNVLKRLDVAVLRIANQYNRGEQLPNGVMSLGLREGGVEITTPTALSDDGKRVITMLRNEFGRQT